VGKSTLVLLTLAGGEVVNVTRLLCSFHGLQGDTVSSEHTYTHTRPLSPHLPTLLLLHSHIFTYQTSTHVLISPVKVYLYQPIKSHEFGRLITRCSRGHGETVTLTLTPPSPGQFDQAASPFRAGHISKTPYRRMCLQTLADLPRERQSLRKGQSHDSPPPIAGRLRQIR